VASAVGYPFPNSKVPRRVWTVSVPIQPCASVSCQFGVSRAVLLDRASTPRSLTPRCVREIAAGKPAATTPAAQGRPRPARAGAGLPPYSRRPNPIRGGRGTPPLVTDRPAHPVRAAATVKGLPVEVLLDGLSEGRSRAVSSHARRMILRRIAPDAFGTRPLGSDGWCARRCPQGHARTGDRERLMLKLIGA
jgi:hypothetical protein